MLVKGATYVFMRCNCSLMPNFKGALTKLLLDLGHRWVLHPTVWHGCNYLPMTIILVLVSVISVSVAFLYDLWIYYSSYNPSNVHPVYIYIYISIYIYSKLSQISILCIYVHWTPNVVTIVPIDIATRNGGRQSEDMVLTTTLDMFSTKGVKLSQ